jgi:hypothetical protein
MRSVSVRALPLAVGLLLPGCRGATAPEVPLRDAFAQTAYAARCATPAPLLGTYTPAAPGIIVQFQPGTAVDAEVARLSEAYAFTPRFVYTHALQGFAAEVPAATVAALRCERSVRVVEWDGVVTIG